MLDMMLHMEKPRAGMVERVVKRVRREIGVLPVYSEDRFPNNFPYIFSDGYDCGFYGYAWSLKFAAAIRIEHLKTGHSVNPIIGRRFRNEFLEASRTRVAQENLIAFFRRGLPSAKALLEQSRLL